MNVIGACKKCSRGYVFFRPGAKCRACGGRIIEIDPVPNEFPHVDGAFVPNWKARSILPLPPGRR